MVCLTFPACIICCAWQKIRRGPTAFVFDRCTETIPFCVAISGSCFHNDSQTQKRQLLFSFCRLQMYAPVTAQDPVHKGAVQEKKAMGSLEDAFGTGRGKHAGKKRRRHSNKYSSKSKAAEIDPWEKQLRKSEEQLGEAKAVEKAELEELERRRVERRIERGLVEYPDEEEIDPYDPSTFGYIEVSLT